MCGSAGEDSNIFNFFPPYLVFPKGIGMDDWISHTNIHGTISSQWVGVSAHLVYLSPPLPSDDHERDKHGDESYHTEDSRVHR